MPTLLSLSASRHAVVLAVSQPDRPRGRGRTLTPSPVSEAALHAGIPLLRPEHVAEAACEHALRAAAPDLGVVVAYGQFLSKRIRECPALGYTINAHASLLPKYRGAEPIARAILSGEQKTGISVMRVEREMDAGPVALVRDLEIGAEETRGELEERLAHLAAQAIGEAIDAIAEGRASWHEQDHAAASDAPKFEPRESELDFHEDAVSLVRRVRARAPRPGAHARLNGATLRILAARAEPGPCRVAPGTLQRGADGLVRIATGNGWLLPLQLQRSGRKPLPSDAFWRGFSLPEGSRVQVPVKHYQRMEQKDGT